MSWFALVEFTLRIDDQQAEIKKSMAENKRNSEQQSRGGFTARI